MEETRNCKEYCRYSKLCYQKGWDDLKPDDCAWYYKIEDLIMDAKYSHNDYDPDEPEDEEEIDE